MKKRIFAGLLALVLGLSLGLVIAPIGETAQAVGVPTLNVAQWTGPTDTGLDGREAVIKVGTTYHMWYSSSDEATLYHTSSTDPASFTAGTTCTFTGTAPVEVGSVTVLEESGTFYMIAYETSTGGGNQKFAIYTSPATGEGSGTAWTYAGTVFDGTAAFTGLPNFVKIDGPYLFKDGDTYRLYLQVKTGTDPNFYYHIYIAEATDTTLTAIADGNADADFTLAGTNPVLSPGTTTTDWDGMQVMHPWVVKDGSTYYMWYSGWSSGFSQQMGFAYSSDGYNWTKSRGNPIVVPATGYAEPSVIVNADGTWQMWCMGTGGTINYLTATGPFEFSSIQSAVTAATAGDTINVAAGTYTEQILIQKSLTLQGAGEATTIIKAPTTRTGPITQGSSTYDYIVAAYPASGTIDVRIEGFTIDANNQAETAGTSYLVGVFFRDVSGTNAGLFSCTIQGFTATEYKSYGIKVDGNSILTIDDNTLSGYTRDGMEIRGSTLGYPAVTISNNDLTGSALPLQGISVIDGTTGSITDNTVRNHTRSAAWAACGILVDNSDGVSVTDNTVLNTFYAIYIGNADNCIVSGNTLTDNIKRAISLDTANNNTISDNTITGPTAGTDDTAIGLDNNCAGNIIGGVTAADGNNITMATSGTGNLYAIYMQALVGANNNTISYNTITGGQRAVQFDGTPGITGTTTISNNTISGQTFGGIVANNNGSLVITNNTLTNTTRPMEFWGPVDVTITGNTINGATFDGINMGNVSGTKLIQGNTFTNILNGTTDIAAIHGRPDADNMTINNNIIGNSWKGIQIDTGCTGTVITNNAITGNAWSGISAYDALLTVTGNIIDTCWRGIEINGALTAHNNSFLNNTYGSVIFYNNDAHDVTDNWWGSASGPGALLNGVNINTFNQASQQEHIQANTYANFTFTPWLNSGVDSDTTTPGFQPAVGTSFAPVKIGTTGYYPSIQSAVTAASAGDTINVAAGTYDEQVVITRSLTLQGAGDTTVIKPSTLTTYITGANEAGSTVTTGIIIANGAGNATIKNLKVDASLLPADRSTWFSPSVANMKFAGVFYYNTGGVIDGVTSTNNNHITIPSEAASTWGRQVQSFKIDAGTSTSVNVELKNSTASNFLGDGVCVGWNANNITVNIHDNTITGDGELTTHRQNGIQVYYATVTGISDNNISNLVHRPTGPYNWATGIMVVSVPSGAVIEGNTISNCDFGIINGFSSGVSILDNDITGSGHIYGTGIYLDNQGADLTGIVVDGNTIGSGFPYGGICLRGWHVTTNTISETISNNVLNGGGSAGYGIFDDSGAAGAITATITGNTITGWDKGISIRNGAPVTGFTIEDNSISGNTTYGIYNGSTGTLNAENNWWGDISGPTHSSNLTGTGDAVSDNVDFAPWIGQPSEIDLEEVIGEEGVIAEEIVAVINPTDGFTVIIPAGTTAEDDEGNPLTGIEVEFVDEDTLPPLPPNAAVLGLAYDFGPDGAQFEPAITLIFTYDEDDIPEGVSEADLRVAYYDEDEGEWVELTDCDVDTVNNIITAYVTHFTTFGLIASPPATVTTTRTVPVPYPGGETTVTITKSSTVTQTRTQTRTQTGVTVTQTQPPTTMTQLSTITQTAGGAVITQTQTQTQVSTAISTVPTTKITTSTITQTVTDRITDWTLTAVLAVVGVLLGALIVAIVARRSQ